MARAVGNRRGECVSLGGMGFGYAALGQLTRALGFYQPALAIARDRRSRRGEHQAGQPRRCLLCPGSVRARHRTSRASFGDRHRDQETARRGCSTQKHRKDLRRPGRSHARDRLHRTRLGDRREVGDRRSEGYALFHRARVFVDEDRHVDAIQQASEAVQIGAETGVPIIISSANTTLALARLCLGDLPSAAQPFLPPLPSMSPRIPITCWRSWG